ncbi:hypothetical protein BJ508DRAFT_314518 [Ascobolus immersus RN42]|uniref:Uncharacterized protein n=1 Tax=Ascobolus immersus RN42 TaxID=1160509 RepID=A0A3N4HGP3_ASCIM|nr:hypothetical protein BJ508DRAFT_314518 [Ascobolus immersus RN42]
MSQNEEFDHQELLPNSNGESAVPSLPPIGSFPTSSGNASSSLSASPLFGAISQSRGEESSGSRSHSSPHPTSSSNSPIIPTTGSGIEVVDAHDGVAEGGTERQGQTGGGDVALGLVDGDGVESPVGQFSRGQKRDDENDSGKRQKREAVALISSSLSDALLCAPVILRILAFPTILATLLCFTPSSIDCRNMLLVDRAFLDGFRCQSDDITSRCVARFFHPESSRFLQFAMSSSALPAHGPPFPGSRWFCRSSPIHSSCPAPWASKARFHHIIVGILSDYYIVVHYYQEEDEDVMNLKLL